MKLHPRITHLLAIDAGIAFMLINTGFKKPTKYFLFQDLLIPELGRHLRNQSSMIGHPYPNTSPLQRLRFGAKLHSPSSKAYSCALNEIFDLGHEVRGVTDKWCRQTIPYKDSCLVSNYAYGEHQKYCQSYSQKIYQSIETIVDPPAHSCIVRSDTWIHMNEIYGECRLCNRIYKRRHTDFQSRKTHHQGHGTEHHKRRTICLRHKHRA